MSVSMAQGNVTRAETQLASLESDLARALERSGKAEGEAHTLAASLTSTLSPSTLRSKQSQLANLRNQVATAQKTVADLRGKVANKRAELHRYQQALADAQRRDQTERDRKAQHARDHELRHQRALAEAEKERNRRAQQARDQELRHERDIATERRRAAGTAPPLTIERFITLPAPPPAAPALREWLETYRPVIYLLEIHRPDGIVVSGTAFRFAPRRFATCAHNICGRVYVCDPFMDQHEATDIALHPLHEKGIDVATFTLPDDVALPSDFIPAASELPRPGDEVAAVAYPAVPRRLPTLSFFPGHVEALPKDYSGEITSIQVSMALAGGMSGGPVIGQDGRVVGIIAEATFEANQEGIPSRRFSHAVPIAHVRELEALIASERAESPSAEAESPRDVAIKGNDGHDTSS